MENEVESRFIVPDRLLFTRLMSLRALGDYTLRPTGTRRVVDEYLDTKGRALTRQGWACRLRRDDDIWLITLKGPRSDTGVVHTRPEIEVTLSDATHDYTRWPQGELRETISRLCGGVALGKLVTVQQRRHGLTVLQGERTVAAMSLDLVRCRGRSMNHKSYMLECELKPGGTPEDLEVLDALLTDAFDLIPEPRSKLRRALDVVERGGLPDVDLYAQLRPVTPRELLVRYGNDLTLGEAVAATAGQLFLGLEELHGLPEEFETVVRTSGLLTPLGRGAGPRQAHIMARTLVLRHELIGLTDDQRQIVAAAVFLQRKRISSDRLAEVLPDDWDETQRRQALTVAALVRMATALGGKASGVLERIQVHDGAARLLLTGADGEKAVRRAARRSDLWRQVSAARLEWGLTSADGDVLLLAGGERKVLGLDKRDSMPTAADKVLGYWYRQMLLHEAGTRAGQDPEELHDMRVAARRMRSALGLFRLYLHGSEPSRANERLRRAGQALGAVRDLDVAIGRAQTYAERLPAQERTSLAPLLRVWGRRRERARQAMLRYLDGREYVRLQQTMATLFASLEAGAEHVPAAQSIGGIAPRLLYVYEAIVEAYDAVLGDAPVQLLHALRIDCKRLRYGLEFFGEVLSPDVQALAPEVVRLQDHLGELHDEFVAIEMLNDYIAGRGRSRARASAEAYRDACTQRMNELVTSFPATWQAYLDLAARDRLKREVKKSAR